MVYVLLVAFIVGASGVTGTCAAMTDKTGEEMGLSPIAFTATTTN